MNEQTSYGFCFDPINILKFGDTAASEIYAFFSIRNKNDSSENNKDSFCLEFYFDCDSACYVQIHFFAKEFVSDGRIQYVFLKTN